jgi:hypothetical protein
MSAQDNLSQQLFHGTAHPFKEGDAVLPNSGLFKGSTGTAFSTTDYEAAKSYAKERAEREGTLFGQVYSVEPIGEKTAPTADRIGPKTVVTSQKGFKVKKHVGWA